MSMAKMPEDHDEENQADDQDITIEKVSTVRLPAFIRVNPKMWFVQIEAIFTGRKIVKGTTKFTEVISNLDSDVLLSLEDVFDRPKEQLTYVNLKERLILEFTASEVRRMQVLLQDLALDDKKPSVLFREMSSLAGKNVTEEFLKNMWTQRLPRHMQSILAVYEGRNEDMLKLADRIAEVNQSPSSLVSSISNKNNNSIKEHAREHTPSRLESMMESMIKQMANLTRSIQANNDRSRSAWRRRDQSNARSRSSTPNPNATNGPKMCFFHKKFGAAATKCTTPYGFPASGN